MKKILWLGVALMIAFSASIGLTAFADENNAKCIGDTSGRTKCGEVEPETNCIDDPTGQTNCTTTGASSEPASLTVDETQVSYGNITEVGRSYTKYITLKNNTAAAMTVRLEATNFSDNNELSATDWIAFAGGKRKYEIKANGSVQVGLRLMVPSDAKGGTYYSKVVINNGKEDEKLEVVVRADVANEDYKYGGEITGQNVGFFNLSDKITAEAKVKNTGTAGFSAHYLVQFKNAFGLSEWKQVKEETRDVIPGAEESFNVADEEANIGYGVFTVEQRISYVDAEGKQKEAVLSHAVLNLPWWTLAIAGGVILLIIVIVVIVKVRRKKEDEAVKAEKRSKKKSATIEVKEG